MASLELFETSPFDFNLTATGVALMSSGSVGLYMMYATKQISEKIYHGIDDLKVTNRMILDKLGSVDNKLDTIDDKLESIDNKLDTIDNKLDTIAITLQSIDKTLREKL